MPRNWIVLVDCNNFFASCEKIFRPDLKDRPVVVLSNNDGCIIARSAEVKRMGDIPMGMPYFKARDLIRQRGVKVFSGNHEFYMDVSRRVMKTLEEFSANVEVYSVDEGFLHFRAPGGEMPALARDIKAKVLKWVGVPVSVGVAPTKTLAKLANEFSKKRAGYDGICCLTDQATRNEHMAQVPIEDVWGIGRRLTPKMRALRIRNALQLATAEPSIIRRKFGVTVERVMRELQGWPCYVSSDDDEVDPQKQVMCSRAFGKKVTEFNDFKEATCSYIEKAGQALRHEGQLCSTMTVFARGARFGEDYDQLIYLTKTGGFGNPTSDTRKLLKLGVELLEELWRPRWQYVKSGVLLSDFSDPKYLQLTFDPEVDTEKSKTLMKTIDRLRIGGYHIQFAAQGTKRPWAAKHNLLSPYYTTRWKDLPRAGKKD